MSQQAEGKFLSPSPPRSRKVGSIGTESLGEGSGSRFVEATAYGAIYVRLKSAKLEVTT